MDREVEMQEIMNFLSFAPVISALLGSIGAIIGVAGVVLASRLRHMQEEIQVEKRISEVIKLELNVEGESIKLAGHDIDPENLKRILDALSKSGTPTKFKLETLQGTIVGDIAGADITQKDTSKNMQENNQRSSEIDSADSIDNKKEE